MRPSFNGDTRDKPRFDLRPSRRRYAGRENFIFVTAEIHQLDSLTIECDFERVGMFQSTDLFDGVGPQFRPDLVLGVNGEVVLNHHSAARAQRQSFNMVPLSQVHSSPKRFRCCRDFRIGHRRAGDLPCDRKIPLHQRR